MAIVIQLVVGELQLVEGNQLTHPVGARRRGIRVHVDARWRHWVCLACHHPA